jgi:Protein of unknown function (DUF2500)
MNSMPFPFAAFSVVFVLVAGFIAFVIIGSIIKGVAQWSSNNAAPQERFPARVVTKRTHVSGGSGDSSASTSYYITFERLSDNARQEFKVKASEYSALADDDFGELAHQGTRYLGFVRSPAPATPPPAPAPAPVVERQIRYCAYCGHQLALDTNKCPGCGSLWHPSLNPSEPAS